MGLLVAGITSTYVENTGFDFTAVKNARDHLHIRGEYKIFGYQIFLMIGSPPHTWRILQAIQDQENKLGITSTYVENTFKC